MSSVEKEEDKSQQELEKFCSVWNSGLAPQLPSKRPCEQDGDHIWLKSLMYTQAIFYIDLTQKTL
jgi:hypothetical protein